MPNAEIQTRKPIKICLSQNSVRSVPKFWNSAKGILVLPALSPTKKEMTNRSVINRSFGLPVRKCLRFSSLLGLILSVLHITVGSILVVFILQVIRAGNESRHEFNNTYEEFMLYKSNDYLLWILSTILIGLNLIQIVSDVLVFNATLNGGRRRVLWMHFLLGILIWVGSLISFIFIFSAGGLILLFTCLFATAIRIYNLFTLHQFIGQQRKASDLQEIS